MYHLTHLTGSLLPTPPPPLAKEEFKMESQIPILNYLQWL